MMQFNKQGSSIPRKAAKTGRRHADTLPEYLARDCGIEILSERARHHNHVQSFLELSIRFI